LRAVGGKADIADLRPSPNAATATTVASEETPDGGAVEVCPYVHRFRTAN
jgi:hypothetical protein